VLAVFGCFAGWMLSLNYFIPFFQKFANSFGIQNNWTVVNLVSFIFANCMIFMIVMQVPLVVIILFNLGILKLNNLTLLRKVMAVVAVTFGAAATPTVDIFSQLLVAVPFYLLFEVALQYCIFKQRFMKQPSSAVRGAKQAGRKKRVKRKRPAPTIVDVVAQPEPVDQPPADSAPPQ
jgi:sec-independent protein translocase protein TatC